MTALYRAYLRTEIGWVEVKGTRDAITGINFVDEKVPDANGDSPAVQAGIRQLTEYFRGERTTFDLPLAFDGTDFQKAVWRALLDIPFGETVSYGDIARAIGNPKAVRAVGGANGKNPISIVAACHRVVGSNGTLTGYGGGLWRKEWLLAHEGAIQKAK